MATSFQPNVHYTFGSPLSSTALFGTRRASDILEQEGYSTVMQTSTSRRASRTLSGGGSSTLADVVSSLTRRSSDAVSSTQITDADYATLLEWIRAERMRKLPPEGSSYDKALVWAALFVERLHSFDTALQQFAGDSHMAAQLAYVHCASLLETTHRYCFQLAEENAPALMDLFGFFYRSSMGLGNLLDRTELFSVSQDIKDQLILALADLVTLVVGVARHFHRSLNTSESVSIDIYSTFPGPIDSFKARCEHVSELMWRHQLIREGMNGDKVTEIRTIKEWLQPEDPVLINVAETTAHFAQEREESTCLWMSPYLTRFLKSDQKVLAVHGKPGSGKTILATVIHDHLQHSVGGTVYKSIFVPINSRIPANTTPRAVAKMVLSQLFDKRIGNVRLYQILSDTFTRSQSTLEEDAYDDLLWAAVRNALKSSLQGAKELVLVVDGMDEASCGEASLRKRLTEAAVPADRVKLIVLGSQQQSSTALQTAVHVSPELVFDDITAVVRKILHPNRSFTSQSEDEQEIMVTRIAEAARGSFLWAKLAAKRIREEGASNAQALSKAITTVANTGKTLTDLVSHAMHAKVSEDALKVLSWLSTAARPLTQKELSALGSIHLDRGTITDKELDSHHLLKPVASLVFIQSNLVYLRHGQIRSAILDVLAKDKLLPAVKNRNSDLAQRLLVYTKEVVTSDHEPSLDPLDDSASQELLVKYPLLDFALRYWITHVKIAFGCATDQEIATAAKELRSSIPTTPTVPLLEMTVWDNKSTPSLRLLHGIQTRVWRQALGPNHPTTLQTVLCQALFYRRIHEIPSAHISKIFYEAAKMSQTVLSTRHLITMQMIKFYLEVTADQVTDSKTTIMTQRTEMLQRLIECYKIHYGASSSMVTSTMRLLSEHYTSMGEETKAKEITTWLQEASTESAPQATGPRQTDDSLLVHLHGRKDTMETRTIFSLDELEQDDLVTRAFDFKSLQAKAERLVAEKDIKTAERTWIELWQQTSKEYRLNSSTEWELRNMDAVLGYAKFLKSQHRENEAASILSGFWEGYGQSTSSSEAVASKFLEVAKVMKSVGLSVLALSVFKHCAQSTHGHSGVHQEVQQHINTTSREVMKMATSTSSTITESSLKEMVFSASTTDQVSMTATNTLLELYLSQHRWQDATKAIKQVLRTMWPAFFAPSADEAVLPASNLESCVELAERLANCYRFRRRIGKEEDVRLRLYHAVRRGRPAGDKLLDRVTTGLLRLYERMVQTEKLITIHQNILSDCKKRYGPQHPTVVKQLWKLAELTRPRPIAVDYYRQIVHILNKDTEQCHPDAFEPLLIVVTDLLNQARYAEALQPCRVLFGTLQKPQISPKLQEPSFAQTLYERYIHCLRMVQSDVAVIHDVTAQYRKACISLFGTSASVTIHATKTLANICQESKRYESEAITLYEELLQTRSSAVEIDYEDIRATLNAIYEEQNMLVHTSKTASMSTEEVKRVISIRTQRLASLRSTHGWAHEESLGHLSEIVTLYTKQGDLQAAATLLRNATAQVLATESSSIQLTAAAKTIAAGYITAGQVDRARELTHELYRQIVAKDTANVGAVGFDLTASPRQSLSFLAELEYRLRQREDASLTLNEVYSALTTEYMYFEQFRTEIGSKSSSVMTVMPSAARLHGFLCAKGRHEDAARLAEQVTNYFLATEGATTQATASQARIFIDTLLEYFPSHTSPHFIRSVAIASYDRVTQLLATADYHSACGLALTAFQYIRAHQGYASPSVLKTVFKLGLVIAGRDVEARPAAASRKEMLEVSASILKETLDYLKQQKVDLTQLDLVHLNTLICVLDEQHDYATLAWILTALWNHRDTHISTAPQYAYTLALGRMLVITRYLTGDSLAAIRLAEDIVYNCARVHGPRHPSTVEMTVLLSQMYTSVAQGYQTHQDRRELAYRYYKKAASLHENALRVFIDPTSVSATEMEASAAASGLSESASGASSPGGTVEDEGKHVRQHLHLLKLAVERLGDWPKEYAEYERLNADLFRTFAADLKDVEGVEKWNLKRFGSGRAEASDDLISPGINQVVGSHERLAIAV
ncbi:NACHT domain protein [Aspergillus saccharolyticus JOP 1030-1]|uniref:NACHT domain protein n=1 Tax=Aspergillus saccharolyticus JOP 1030-1 TaxID=1450539 RepID=A0A318Z6J1_9EURO|nr:NACHT domain protein [Aspergillus saccharolyticus JOP 1030-1]PYH42905.1 NACHT domain protein [Aspergillus saccharolyticus JOP 1030-1]